MIGAGILTGLGQLLLVGLSSGNGIDINAATWFAAGRQPALRTLGSAVLSIFLVGMGVSLGREGAPKQAGAVFGNWFADAAKLSDEQRRLPADSLRHHLFSARCWELTGHNRASVAPMLLAVTSATLVARSIELRSIYDAKLNDQQVAARMAARAPSAN